jgi:hypothetical protein
VSACLSDRSPYRDALVTSEIIEHHDISWRQRWDQELLDPSEEELTIDRAIKNAGRVDPIGSQSGQEGHGLPSAVRHVGDKPFALWSATMRARHVRLRPSLVDEDQAPRINLVLVTPPALAFTRDVRTMLFGRVQAFF